jgi:hypothetical protein
VSEALDGFSYGSAPFGSRQRAGPVLDEEREQLEGLGPEP